MARYKFYIVLYCIVSCERALLKRFTSQRSEVKVYWHGLFSGVAQFMRDSILLRDTAGKNSGCYTMLPRDKLHCIVNYLATM